MRYYIIAGEASGDLHGSNLIKGLKNFDAEANIRCWGGDLMQQAGGHLVKHYKDLAFMGFIEVVKNLPVILRNLQFCKKDIEDFSPDVLVLIDYPGFNLRIATWAKTKNYKIVYYISPQVWAWKQSRVKLIKKVVDKMLVILPFEKDFYKKWNYNVEYVGHPLVEVVHEFLQMPEASLKTLNDKEFAHKKIIALLPGSRKQEILVKLPVMLSVAENFPEYRFVIAQAPGQPLELYQQLIHNYTNVDVALAGQTYTLLRMATAALVTSGTATLETALFGVPQVVCYKGSYISYQIAKRLVKVKFISLVNLIMDREVVKELIQEELTVQNLQKELQRILNDEHTLQKIKKDYAELKDLLQQQGQASAKAAQEIFNLATTV